MTTQRWHVLYTKPHQESLVFQQLEGRDLDAFFPFVRLERGHRRGTRVEPVFPHYIFVKVDLMTRDAASLQWLPGVRSLVRFGDQPAIIPDAIIQQLRERLGQYQDRVLRKSEWQFQPGQKVEVVDGPFSGFDAIFQEGLSGANRVKILLNLAGTWTRTQLDVEQIRAGAN